MSNTEIKKIKQEALEAFSKAKDSQNLHQLKVRYLGKKGSLSALLSHVKNLPLSERPQFGIQVNEAKGSLEKAYKDRLEQLQKDEVEKSLSLEQLDMTLPGPEKDLGRPHLISCVIDEIVDTLSRLGYSVRLGPLIETNWYNFEALNIPPHHPSREMQDTFYIDEDHVLRTHTSPVQIRTLENEKPPLRVLAPGAVFRCDSDGSHSPNFHQMEGLLVDENVSFAHLKGTISFFVKEFFGKELKTRFRPSYFPFTEPSAEMDCQCPQCGGKGCGLCKQTGWIEIGGSGLVHPQVFKLVGTDPQTWQGFAFGFGIERMAMVKYGIEDIRLFSENDLRFLDQ